WPPRGGPARDGSAGGNRAGRRTGGRADGGALPRARRRGGRVQPAPLGEVRPALLLPDRPVRGLLEPRSLRRCPLRAEVGGSGGRAPRALRTDALRGVRRRA